MSYKICEEMVNKKLFFEFTTEVLDHIQNRSSVPYFLVKIFASRTKWFNIRQMQYFRVSSRWVCLPYLNLKPKYYGKNNYLFDHYTNCICGI
jgi:hypothetical protein